jgi:hypothetical protein
MARTLLYLARAALVAAFRHPQLSTFLFFFITLEPRLE